MRGLVDEDYFVEVDVQRVPGGAFSAWIHEELQEGDSVKVQGPLGDCHYRPEDNGRPLILIGTGTGVAPLHGVVRDALRQGHTGGIWLYFGAREARWLYAHEELTALAAQGVSYRAVVIEGSGDQGATERGAPLQGDVVTRAFAEHPDASSAVVFLCGDTDLVHRARCEAVLAGARRDSIRADPFESDVAAPPRDTQIIEGIKPDPELWEALGRGPKLRAILEDFYAEVYQDERLSPFFHNVTRERAIDKQYSFLADMFAGTKDYFGLKPFNAHHWMVISDELFDYREAMFERHLRRHQVPEPMIRRWEHLHELFRRDIVKSRTRGLFLEGVEYHLDRFQEEVVTVAGLCDGCSAELLVGDTCRLHVRTGQAYCQRCDAAAAE